MVPSGTLKYWSLHVAAKRVVNGFLWRVGAFVGAFVGACVGAFVGACVGAFVGACVGAAVIVAHLCAL